jgi:hypothetical protein
VTLPLKDEPRDIAVGADNDLIIVDGEYVLARGIDAVAQDCRIAVQTFLGEWFRDPTQGIPWFQAILAQKSAVAATAAARLSIRSALQAVDGVISVTRLDITRDRRRGMTITWVVVTARGETPVSEINLNVGQGNT